MRFTKGTCFRIGCLNFQPGVVTGYTWGPNPTTTPVLNLTVRNDVKFHDGTTLTPDDIGFSMTTAATSTFAYGGVWNIITTI